MKKAVVIFPGRGTYNQSELGYLKNRKMKWIECFDQFRQSKNKPTISELDASANFSPKVHTAGEHAAALIGGAALTDYAEIDREQYEVVAVTGNSMGWYLAMAAAGALHPLKAAELIDTMGSLPSLIEGEFGAQVIYPIVNENWQFDSKKYEIVTKAIHEIQKSASCQISIRFGGYVVIGVEQKAAKLLMELLPTTLERFPFKLMNNNAFHTPLLKPVSAQALRLFSDIDFHQPSLPMIDGKGKIWMPHSTDITQLRQYTLKHQVIEAYDFSLAVEISLKEFAPDILLITGPGTTLGGAVGQVAVDIKWMGIRDKKEFSEIQKKDPFMLSLGQDFLSKDS